jgi:hypothetical protein
MEQIFQLEIRTKEVCAKYLKNIKNEIYCVYDRFNSFVKLFQFKLCLRSEKAGSLSEGFI